MSSPRKRRISKDDRPYLGDRKRSDSMWGELGHEGNPLPDPKSHAGKCVGIFTSGGDSQGMSLCYQPWMFHNYVSGLI